MLICLFWNQLTSLSEEQHRAAMACATRKLCILLKIYNGSGFATYSALTKPVTRITLVRTAQSCFYSTDHKRPQITGSLTNMNPASSPFGELNNGTVSKVKQHYQGESSKEDEEDRKQREQQWKMMKLSFIFFGITMSAMGLYIVYELTRPNYDENGNIMEDEFSGLPYWQQLWKRFCRELNHYKKFVQEPSRDKLLPEPLKHPYMQPPYTLVLEMTDVLVHPDWTYQTGWRFKKRPGVDQFLEAVAPPQFEIVIYTAEQGMTVFPILDSLDPQGFIMYRLVRDATRFVDGHHVKDLDALNRDLSKVIVVDWNSESIKLHPENALKIPRWTGNDDDTSLYDLAAFLKTVLTSNVDDIRDVLNYYRQFENPLGAFRENQRKLLQQMQEDESQKREGSKVLMSKWTPSFLRNR